MRKMLPVLLLPVGLLVLISSCKKHYPDNNVVRTSSEETFNVKVAPNQAYQLSLNDVGTVNISRQAAHFLVSEAQVNNENATAVYNYTPAKDFSGNDEVLLLSTKTVVNYAASYSGGCQGGGNSETSISSKYITVKFTVAN